MAWCLDSHVRWYQSIGIDWLSCGIHSATSRERGTFCSKGAALAHLQTANGGAIPQYLCRWNAIDHVRRSTLVYQDFWQQHHIIERGLMQRVIKRDAELSGLITSHSAVNGDKKNFFEEFRQSLKRLNYKTNYQINIINPYHKVF